MKKIAVVTGASSGMGRDFVRAVDREFSPQEIWVIARREDRLLALQEQVHAAIVPFAMDLSRASQLGIVELNDRALTAMCHMSLPYMHPGSKIINLGSNSAWQPVPYMSVYGASKAYVLSFSRALDRELKGRDIQVLCVCPGWVKTEFMDRAVHDSTVSFFDRWYESEDVVEKAMRDLRKGKTVSILGFPVRMQVRLVKLLPVRMIMNIWCKQQKKP